MFGWEFPPHIAGGLGTACYVKGAQQVLDKFSEIIGIKAGETSEGKTPLTEYTEGDVEPKDVFNGGEK